MKRDRGRIKLAKFKELREEHDRWQKETGVTLVEIRPTEVSDVYEYNIGPLRKMVDDVLALAATGMSEEEAVKIVTDKVKRGAA